MKTILMPLLGCLLVGAAAGTAPAREEQGERDMEATHCVRIQGIEDIDIVNSGTLVFRMRGDEVYRNDLPHECPGLRPGDTLMYRSSVGQLCSVDIITVLEDRGFGFSPGASCGLGMFEPITEQIADEMVRAEEG